MEVQIEETGRFGRKLSVTIPSPDVDKAFDEVVREFAKAAQIPGFRPGKVPRQVVEQQYGPKIKGEVRDRLVSGTLLRALDDKKVSPVGVPHLHLGELARGGVFSYTAEFDVQPEVKVTQSKGLKVPALKTEVTDAEIDKQLEAMRANAAELVPVLVRDTVEKGDVVLIDYEGTMGGVPFKGGSAQNALVEVGAEGYLPQFSEGLLGAKCPGERVVPVDFPADYGAKELAGKQATFKMTVKEIKKKELPTLDDEFARDLGEETLAGLRDKVRESMLAHKQHEAEADQRRALLDALVAANPIEVPESMVRAQADRMVSGATARVEQMMGRRFNLSEAELENLRKDSLESAGTQVRSGLLLLEIAKQEKIEVDSAELDAEIDRMASSAGEEAPRVKSHYRDPDNSDRLRFRMLEDKVIKFLLANAEITGEQPAKD